MIQCYKIDFQAISGRAHSPLHPQLKYDSQRVAQNRPSDREVGKGKSSRPTRVKITSSGYILMVRADGTSIWLLTQPLLLVTDWSGQKFVCISEDDPCCKTEAQRNLSWAELMQGGAKLARHAPQYQNWNCVRYCITQNCNFSKTGSCFMEKMSSGCLSNVLRLLCLSSVIHGGSWKLHVGCSCSSRECWCFVPLSEEVWLSERWRSSARMDTRTRAEWAGNVTGLNSLDWLHDRGEDAVKRRWWRKETVSEQEEQREFSQTGV